MISPLARSLAVAAFFVAACRPNPAPVDSSDAAKPLAAAASVSPAMDAAPANVQMASDAAVTRNAENAAYDASMAIALDGGASACRRVFGPAKAPFDGPAILRPHGDVLEMVANDHGHPRITTVPIPTTFPAAGKTISASVIAPQGPSFTVTHPRCAVANDVTYCVGGGQILARYDAHGARSEIGVVAAVRGIAAAPLGPDHAAVAWMQTRKTTEGMVSEAFIAVDSKLPVRLSEEGSGATALDMAARGDDLVALYLDARTAMTPVHARLVHLDMTTETNLKLDEDTVLFVGPLALPGTAPVLGISEAHTDALLAWPKEASGFGMAAIELTAPLKVDLDASWSPYPNGLDPAPIAATHGKKMHVARILPLLAAPHSPLALELGEVGDHGLFQSFGAITSGSTLSDISIADDARGGTWILWSDADSTWLERRVCP